MEQSIDFKQLQEQIQTALVSATRTVAQISSEDLPFQRSLHAGVGTAIDEQNHRLLGLSNALLKSVASVSEIRVSAIQDTDDLESEWHSVVDVIDSLLEKADTCLDEYTGVIKRKDVSGGDQTLVKPRKNTALNPLRTQNIIKPQLTFKEPPDNESLKPWKPLLTSKPHAILSLEESLDTFGNYHGLQQYHHPYEKEISELIYPDRMYQIMEPIPYLPVESTSALFVDTLEGVLEMLEELKDADEIAIDLEHHDARSYIGLVSLMQISTRKKDWIVDTLKPWRQELQILNQVFADPKIIKILHGAFMDIVWLQRDLGLYIVGLFDTYHASRTLGYPAGSLAFLLKKFINFDADKQYQMADWRIRPLPNEMFFYARADTHFLLYIFDNIRNELVERSNSQAPDENRIEIALKKSKETSLQRFEFQVYNSESGKGPGGWLSMLQKTPALLDREQFSVFKAVHEWRDQIARKDDESTWFVMSNNVLLSIAKLMPMDMVALLSIVRPISQSVKSRSAELLELIKMAKAKGLNGPSAMEMLHPKTATTAVKNQVLLPISNPSSGLLNPIIDEAELRSEKSTFWGDAFGSSLWDGSGTMRTSSSLRLAIPLPSLSSEIYAIATRTPSKPVFETLAELTPAPSTAQPIAVDEPFVIRGTGKRKAEELSSSDEIVDQFDISLNDEKEEQARTKAAIKAEQRAAKKARKAQKKAEAEAMGQGNIKTDPDGEEPFDYAKAASVLHKKHNVGDHANRKGKKPFDPYSKSADAPKGMRRAQSERAGKSFTFKK